MDSRSHRPRRRHIFATIADPAGDEAARGRIIAMGDLVVFDRIATADAHQRRGLGTAIMRASPPRPTARPPRRDALRYAARPRALRPRSAGRCTATIPPPRWPRNFTHDDDMTDDRPRPPARRTYRCAASSSAALITLLFTAANVYLGLKVGLTFATSIPAAVISMAILRLLPNAQHPREQHRPDDRVGGGHAGGDHLRPARADHDRLVAGLSLLDDGRGLRDGGMLGVMFSVPLRRALVTGSDLPYPEGVAAAEVLKVGAGAEGGEENAAGLRMLVHRLARRRGLRVARRDEARRRRKRPRTSASGGGATGVSTSFRWR